MKDDERAKRIKERSKKLQETRASSKRASDDMNTESAQALTAAIVALQQYLKDQVAADKVKSKPSTTPVYDLYDDTNPFDLATRTGLSAFEASCLALDAKWDGSPETWPAFLLALRDRADECAWDMAGDTGIAYGKQHRRPWTTKRIGNRTKIKEAKSSGEVVSVDQLISPTPGFVPTHRGIPTTKRYQGATVFVDHYSNFVYVHLMLKMDAASTTEAKQAFERIASSHNITIKHYHCDNGLFDTKLFRESVKKAGQTMSFCGVNAHHQNGKAESTIKDITTGARTSLLHAILISPYRGLIQREIKSLQEAYDLTDDGILKDYLGTRFNRRTDGSIELSQPKMIERVLRIVGLDINDNKTKMHDTPADSNNLLDNDPNGKTRKQTWNYRSAVGALSYLHSMIRPDCTFATQQAARFCNNPQRQHEEAVKRICRYLLRTKDKGIILRPNKKKGLECMVDADWAGSWRDRSSHDPLSSHSRTGYVIMYAGCPIAWKSQLQSLISLSTTEAEYIALSSALREVIGIMNLIEELRSRNFKLYTPTPKVTCRTFEDNRSCIEIATNHKTRAITKHLSVRLHHFRSHVVEKTITIEHISTKEQLGDIFTKPLPKAQFEYLRDKIMSWSTSQLPPSDDNHINERILQPTIARE